ncbi:hypothetical protein [Rhodocyclus tenuis]|uniref:hypothetical protein n=1 Tax=Rhodocyclus tenuis TaxID=1066 RepID=UPI001904C3B6|nr:hypothetical protein [Rhodocyclus tenuis]MBK1681262.1 hypothetical protein [Rhodocyclus tenuis]
MYLVLKHSHTLSAALSLLVTLAWAAFAWNGAKAGSSVAGKLRAIYVANRAITGIAGITGLAVTFVGPWREFIYPYLGLAAFVVHGIFAATSKRAFGGGNDSRLRLALLAQIAALLVASALMATKFA